MGRFIVVNSNFFNFKRYSFLFRLLRNSLLRISGVYQNCNLLKDERLKDSVWAVKARGLVRDSIEYQVVVYLQEGREGQQKPCSCRLLKHRKLDV